MSGEGEVGREVRVRNTSAHTPVTARIFPTFCAECGCICVSILSPSLCLRKNMKRLNKLFAKKEKDEHTQEPVPLSSMTNNELCAIIYRYDEELKRLNPQLLSLQEERDKALSSAHKHSEESSLYKQLAETSQLQLQAINSELDDVKEVLQSKKAEVELLRSQMVTTEEVNSQLKRQLEGLKAPLHPTDTSTSTSSYHRDQFEDRIRELEIVKKNLEAELMRVSFQSENTANQLKQTKDKLTEMTEKSKEMDREMKKKQGSLDTLKQEMASFGFQKESMEAEIRELKELTLRKDALISKQKLKITSLKSSNIQLKSDFDAVNSQISTLQSQLNTLKSEYSERNVHIETSLRAENEKLRGNLEEKDKEIEDILGKLKLIDGKWEESERKCGELEEKIGELEGEKKKLVGQLEDREMEERKLKEALEAAQKKREQARSEVIKLSQKLEQRPSPAREDSSSVPTTFFPGPIDFHEVRLLPLLKQEVEQVYKFLMKAMMSAKDTPYPSDDLTKEVRGLLMMSDLFAEVERKLNDLVMHLHEVMDATDSDTDVADSPQSWSGMLTSAVAGVRQAVKAVGPVKLFSCMPNTREHPTPAITMKPRTEQGRKMISSTGGDRRVDQQQTPPLGYKRF